MTMKRKLLSLFLCTALFTALMPVGVLAAGEGQPEEQAQTEIAENTDEEKQADEVQEELSPHNEEGPQASVSEDGRGEEGKISQPDEDLVPSDDLKEENEDSENKLQALGIDESAERLLHWVNMGSFAGLSVNAVDENVNGLILQDNSIITINATDRDDSTSYTFDVQEFANEYLKLKGTYSEYSYSYAVVADPNYYFPDNEGYADHQQALFGSKENPVIRMKISGQEAKAGESSMTWYYTMIYKDGTSSDPVSIYGNADGDYDGYGKYCPYYLKLNVHYTNDEMFDGVIFNPSNKTADKSTSNGAGRTFASGLSGYADDDGNITITLPDNQDMGHTFVVYQADDGTEITSTLGSFNDPGYEWKIAGWYNIVDGAYYSVEDGECEVAVNLHDRNVFYADYVPVSYDLGDSQDPDLLDTVSTADFVDIRLFDYNELANLYSTDLMTSTNAGDFSASTIDEVWGDCGSFYDVPASIASTGGNRNRLQNSFVFLGVPMGSPTLGWPQTIADWNISNEYIHSASNWGINNPRLDKTSNPVLWSYFSPDSDRLGVTYVGKADHLLQFGGKGATGADGQDLEGYYYYSSKLDSAAYNQAEERFYIYDRLEKGYSGSTELSMFLPFNYFTDEAAHHDRDINYWFGMSMQVDFYLPHATNGPNAGTENTFNGKDMVFNFSGDDDIMIFVDNQLVLDMAGMHTEAVGNINFAKGTWEYYTYAYDGVTKKDSASGYLNGINSGDHTLTVYYMERGRSASNLTVSFNILPEWAYESDHVTTVTANKVWSDGADVHTADTVEVGLYADDALVQVPVGTNPATLSAENDWTYAWDLLDDAQTYAVKEIEQPKGYVSEITMREDADSDYQYWSIIGEKELEDFVADKPDSEVQGTTMEILLTDAAQYSEEGNASSGRILCQDLTAEEAAFSMRPEVSSAGDGTTVSGRGLMTTYGIVSDQDIRDDMRWTLTYTTDMDSDVYGSTGIHAFTLSAGQDGQRSYLVLNSDGTSLTTTTDSSKAEEFYCDAAGELRLHSDPEKRVIINQDGSLAVTDVEGTYQTNNIRIYTLTTGHTMLYAYEVLNTSVIEISGIKTWEDADDQDGIRPASVDVYLLADGKRIFNSNGDALMAHVIPDAEGCWEFHFSDLPKFNENGDEIQYTVEEDAVKGYEAEVSTETDQDGNYTAHIVNRHVPETVEISGAKTWDDQDDQDACRPASITVRLLADEVEADSVIVTAAEGWRYSFKDLPKYNNGTEISYRITEDALVDYTTSYDGYDIMNKHTPDQTSVTVVKIWNDKEDQDGLRPVSITVRLLADGKDTGLTLVLDESCQWMGTFTELDLYRDQGIKIEYSVEEVGVPEGYVSEISGGAAVGFRITNTHETASLTVSGSKIWEDQEDLDGLRPAFITIRLMADGTEISYVRVSTEDDWTFSFKDLPKYQDGKEIEYTITEDPVEGYASVLTGDAAQGYEITNTHTPVEKGVDTDGDGFFEDDGVEVHVGDDLPYQVRYFNYKDAPATVIITDTLDEALDFVSASDDGQYNDSTRTITWTIENAPEQEWGSVTFTATVNAAALLEDEIENTASVQIGQDKAVDTNTVRNPVPDKPEKEPDDGQPGTDSGNGGTVKTGDNSHMGLWLVLLLAGLVCIIAVLRIRKGRE